MSKSPSKKHLFQEHLLVLLLKLMKSSEGELKYYGFDITLIIINILYIAYNFIIRIFYVKPVFPFTFQFTKQIKETPAQARSINVNTSFL